MAPERRPADPLEITPDAAQRFLADWSFAHAPVEAIDLGTAMCRQPGGVVITSLARFADLPHWWRLGSHDGRDAAGAAGAHVLAHEVADPSGAG
jgi:hypothetical protein